MPTETVNKKERQRINPGEPGCHLVTKFEGGDPVSESYPVGSPSSSSRLPALVDQENETKVITLSPSDEFAYYRAGLIKGLEGEASKKNKTLRGFLDQLLSLYNSGLLLPTTYKKLGHVSRRTFYRWKAALSDGGVENLAPESGRKGLSKITNHEKNLLLTLVLHQNRLKIAYAITLTKQYLRDKSIESPSSPATLRRFIDQFRKEHYDIWVRKREGDKALNDKVLPYAERDWHRLEVGDGLVADGHRLNFQVIHPATGKPCRAALVLFWDWRSSYPLGWEIMIEENIQCVASALRNSILALGKIPKWVLLDNGKAFRAKIFTEDISFEDTDLPGMFARLDINYHFAQPYNAQAKPIERIFGILNEQLERLVPSYTGASIEDKPAYTKRNEKYARSLHNPYVPTIKETNDLFRAWRDRYAERPSRGRDGLRPIDIYNDGKGSGIDPLKLTFLMMDREIKNVHRNGVTWLGWHWYDENLYGLKDKVVIRYSLSDLSQIYVFHKNEFLCAAHPIEKVNPMASESDNPKDMEAVKDVLRLKKKVKNTTRKLCDLLDSKAAASIDWSRPRTSDIAETIQKIEADRKPKVVNLSPFVDDEPAQSVLTLAPGEADQTVSSDEAQRPKFKYDFEKYDWLLEQSVLTPEDRKWIEEYRSSCSSYKHKVFDDDEELDKKVMAYEESKNCPKYKSPRDWSGYYEWWERYEYHLKQDPEGLTQDDLNFIDWYKITSEYKAIYEVEPGRILSGG
jgi:putative transposase